jgi:hypothetical protein
MPSQFLLIKNLFSSGSKIEMPKLERKSAYINTENIVFGW